MGNDSLSFNENYAQFSIGGFMQLHIVMYCLNIVMFMQGFEGSTNPNPHLKNVMFVIEPF